MDRVAARRRAFELVQDVQAGDEDAPGALNDLAEEAERRNYGEVVRACLFGLAVASWITQDGRIAEVTSNLVRRAEDDDDDVMVALGLAMRASFVGMPEDGGPDPSFDASLAEAVVLLEGSEGSTLERISAYTACGIAFDFRSLWELGDEQYAAALRLGAGAEESVGRTMLAAVMFNRAETQVSWAAKLRQVGDTEGLAERWESWQMAAALTRNAAMPAEWEMNLTSLSLLMAAISGQDVEHLIGAAFSDFERAQRADPRTEDLLLLARALSSINGRREDRHRLVDEAVEAIDPDHYPQLFDLALYLAAEVEAELGPSAGLRRAQREIRQRWSERTTQLAAMRSRIEGNRLRPMLDRLSHEANHDDLTGIANRRALANYIGELVRRNVERVAVIMVDIDDFKVVNDRHGHDVGDAVLIRISQILEQGVRPVDLSSRLGGDEFLVALADTDGEVAERRAERLMAELDSLNWEELSPNLKVTLSMGVASGARQDFELIRSQADRAVYKAKHTGGHHIVYAG